MLARPSIFDAGTCRVTGTIHPATAGLLVALALGLAACTPEARSSSGAAALPQPVQVMTVAMQSAGETWSYTGVVRPRFEIDHSFRVGGKVVNRAVDVGQAVVAGQELARLDDTDLRLALEAQEAELKAALTSREQAEAALGRFTALFEKGHVAQAALDQRRAAADEARSRVSKAERNVELARNQLSYARLLSVSAGVVTSLSVEAGQVVAAGQAIVRVAQLSELEVAVAIPEHMAGAVQSAEAGVTFWNSDGARIPALIRELSPEADRVTRTYQARFSLPAGTSTELGRTAVVHLHRGGAERITRLPLSAVMNDGRSAHVYVLDDTNARVRRTPVAVVNLEQRHAVIASGLKPGDRVVTMGVHRLDDGRPVRVVEQRAEGTGRDAP